MTIARFLKRQAALPQNSNTTSTRRHIGLAWLAVWLLVGGTFGYRALTHETGGEAIASLSTAASQGKTPTRVKPIEQIEVGERVAFAINPTEAFDDSLGTDIHPQVWRKIELRPDPHSRIVLLRPEWWVNERLQADSQKMSISIPEVGIYGDAEVISITACPRIPDGEGRVVTGTFAHLAQKTIRLTISGVSEPIRCTPNHATSSVEARGFVEAQDLKPGQHVLCRAGIYEVAKIEHLAEPIEVFNLEIFGQHVYQITTGGMLVHNGTAGDCGMPHGPGHLPDDAIVVRGEQSLPENFSGGTGVITGPTGKLDGVSVRSARGTSAADLSANIKHNQIGQTTPETVSTSRCRIGRCLPPKSAIPGPSQRRVDPVSRSLLYFGLNLF
ncbi:MAG: polymorphic toxin-type HINT domain-containing protein, partial [Planctomycetota bacterium]